MQKTKNKDWHCFIIRQNISKATNITLHNKRITIIKVSLKIQFTAEKNNSSVPRKHKQQNFFTFLLVTQQIKS